MSLPWFRFYTEWADDPKVQMLSEAYQRRLAMLFCYEGQGWLRNASDEELSFKLRISMDELEKTRKAFQEKGFINCDSWGLLNWEKRQKQSDISTSRVRKHRMKRDETVSETVPIVPVKQRETNETVLEERREEEIRREQKRLEQRREDSARAQKRGSLTPLVSIFSNGSSTPPPSLPRTLGEMKSAAYVFSNRAPCKGCGVEIEWWTSPKGALLPMNVMNKSGDGAVVHLETCVIGAAFRKH
jgi:hypothetical protein